LCTKDSFSQAWHSQSEKNCTAARIHFPFTPKILEAIKAHVHLSPTSFIEHFYDTKHDILRKNNWWLKQRRSFGGIEPPEWILRECFSYHEGGICYDTYYGADEACNKLAWFLPEVEGKHSDPGKYCPRLVATIFTTRLYLRTFTYELHFDTTEFVGSGDSEPYLIGSVTIHDPVNYNGELAPLANIIGPDIPPAHSKIIECIYRTDPEFYKLLVDEQIVIPLPGEPYAPIPKPLNHEPFSTGSGENKKPSPKYQEWLNSY